MAKSYGNRWVIIDSLPESGQAWTYKIQDNNSEGKEVYVLKKLKNPKRIDRFEKEITALTMLDHKGIARLIDFNLTDEYPWFIQEYYKGGNLEAYVNKIGSMDPSLAMDFFIQLTDGLVYSHSKKVFHYDIKPANIFLKDENGPIIIGDFGLCWIENSGDRLTSTDEVVGSIHFNAPEVRDGRVEEKSWHSDIYSLGKVLYYMLSGGKIFDREIHRNPERNLITIRKDYRFEYINDLLDWMIVFEPEKRKDAPYIYEKAIFARKLIDGHFAPLTLNVKIPCRYCGIGIYTPVVYSDIQFYNYFGLQATAIAGAQRNWRIMECNSCGNLQWFRIQPDYDWWPEQK